VDPGALRKLEEAFRVAKLNSDTTILASLLAIELTKSGLSARDDAGWQAA
jgi:hypothetical protein